MMADTNDWFTGFFGGLYGRVLAHTFSRRQTLRHATLIRRLLGVRRGNRVLDIPCGQGRVTLPLARMGLAMTGVDFMPAFLRRARADARREGLAVRYIRADMRAIDFDAEFHAAFNWFSSFGYFCDADNMECLRRVRRALKPGGRFLVDGLNKSWYVRHLHKRVDEMRGGVRIVHRSCWDEPTQRSRDQWRMSAGGQVEQHAMAMRVFNGADIRRLLTAAGFRDIRLFGYPSIKKLTANSPRLIAVGRK
jgi:ubiquinone/menaquinone biosynthesis C-methylase UbiE